MITFPSILTNPNSRIFIAHRGSPTRAHENTIESFERAIEDGADAVEFDVRKTQDGILVIHHDEKIQGAEVPLAEQTYDEALAVAHRAGFRLATLLEVVECCSNRISLDVELKEAGYESEVLNQVLSRFDTSHILFKSFIDESVIELKRLNPKATVGLLLGVAPPATFGKRLSELFPEARLTKTCADFVAPHWKLTKFGFFSRMKRRHMPVLVWTVDDPIMAKKLIGSGVVGIISNVAGQIKTQLAKQ